MKKTWEIPQVEIEHAIIPNEEFDQLLDEWAEIVYCHFCQLREEDQAEVLQPLQRTGTDG